MVELEYSDAVLIKKQSISFFVPLPDPLVNAFVTYLLPEASPIQYY